MSLRDMSTWSLPFARRLATVCVCVALFAARAIAEQGGQATQPPDKAALEPVPFSLDIDAAAPGNPLVVTRPDNGMIPVRILNGGTREVTGQAEASLFTSESGSVAARVLADCTGPPAKAVQTVSITLKPAATYSMCLVVDPLPTSARYTGRFILTAPGIATFVKAITVTQPVVPQGTLLLDYNNKPLTLNRPFWPREASRGASVNLSVTVREKSGTVPLQGLSVRLEQVTTSPESGFDLSNNVVFFIQGNQVPLASLSSQDATVAARTIEAGKQAQVQIGLRGLMPGDYAAVLRFSAQNSAADDGQKLQLNIHVRDSLLWAVAWLILALIISLIGTKVLTSLRRRAGLLQQLHALQPPWFAVLPSIAPVTWARATLHQAERLSRRFWLTGADQIEANVNSVKTMLKVLDRYRETREKLAILEPLTLRRATRSLDDTLSGLTGASLDDAAVQRITAELDVFNNWLKNDTFTNTFWNTVQPGMQAILDEIGDLKEFPDTGRDLVTTLKNDVATALTTASATPPTDRAVVRKAYEQYAKLRVLWQHRQNLDGLIELAKANNLPKLFEQADRREWEGLRAQTFKIRWPDSSDPDGFEAYQSLQFSVGFGTDVPRSYLYRHKIEYHWTFELTPTQSLAERLGLRRPPAPVTLTPTSLGPSVVQYFPRPGTTRVAVELAYEGQPIKVPASDGPRINKSSDYSALKILAGADWAGWVIAGIVAIATGLSTFYYKGTSWGTYQDYLTLLLWGVGVDQGKNFLQALQTFSPGSSSNQPKT